MSTAIEVRVPDIGDFKDVPVLEVMVAPGATIQAESPLITLESDKATIDVPAPAGGTVKEVAVRAGQRVSQGSLILTLLPSEQTSSSEAAPGATPIATAAPQPEASHSPPTTPDVPAAIKRTPYAGPAVRTLCHLLGVDPASIVGSGPRGRILKEDVYLQVKRQGETSSSSHPPAPRIDFERFGPIDRRPMSRIQKLSGANLARNWATIPHVTNFEEADITDLESFRVELNKESEVKITALAFLIKACALTLAKFPEFNASLDGDAIILKKYCHIGFAADTPNGLVVPVIRDVREKGLLKIAKEAADLATLAREGKLKMADMEGGCFSISSLGGVGGVGFTPIINAPEVAILGAAKARILPRWDGQQAVARFILPLSLSWDHRALDGVAAGRFLVHLSAQLSDLRRWVL